jgi:DNA-binding MarR family transcriptional regulator
VSELALRLIETIPRVRQTLVVRLRRQGVRASIPQLQILDLLQERRLTVSQLAELQGVTKATMSVSLARMAGQGLIQRLRPPGDRRRVVIELTAKGRAVSRRARRKAERVLDEMIAGLSHREQAVLLKALAQLLTAAEGADAADPDR